MERLESRQLLSASAVGPETLVNTYTASSQRTNEMGGSIAMAANGNYVVTWSSHGQDGSLSGVYAQRYNAAGVAQGSEFRVNTTTANRQAYSTVALDADGDFVVTWSSYGQDGSGYGVYAQRYNAAGVAQGGEFRVNTYTTSNQYLSTVVAMDADGDFVVTWTSFQDGSGYGVYAQRYNAAGVAQGGEFRVNTYTTSSQRFSTVAMDADGDFVVTWSSYRQDGSGYGVNAQRYQTDMSPILASPTAINLTDTSATDTFSAQTGSLSATDADLPAQTLTYGITGGTLNGGTISRVGTYGTLTVTVATGAYSYAPNATAINGLPSNDVDNFSVTASDGSLSDTKTLTVNITAVNDTPVATTGSLTADEDVLLSSDLYSSVSDAETADAGLSYSQVGGPLAGLTLNSNGTFTYLNPTENFNGTVTFQYQVSDGTLTSAVQTITINVAAVNDAPTNVNLSSSSVVENSAIGTTVGNFSTTDPDSGNTFTYSLIAGTGSTDNASFTINGSTLKTAAVFDYETKSSYSIRVQVTDQGGLTYDKAFTINVTNVNEAPTEINLSNSSVAENLAIGATVGSFSTTDADSGNTFTYSFIAGTGSTDNASFTIDGSTLKTAAVFDYETKSSYSVRVRVTDQGGLTYDKAFTINVTNVNEAPTEINLSNSSAAENSAIVTTVGSFSTTDADSGNTFTYSFIAGTGSTDNASFTIDGSTLKTAAVFDYETKSSYSVLVRVTDQGGLFYDKVFTISVTNVNEAPTEINLSSSSVAENSAIGTTVGSFSTTDADSGNTFTYSFIAGTGSTDNASFTIDGSTLKTAAVFDYETKSSYSVRVQVTDQGGLTYDKIFTISVTDVQEDVTPPSSRVTALPATSTSASFTVAVTGTDSGVGASGIADYDLYYSTGSSFIKFATVTAATPSTTFTGAANTTYWFRSIARDAAGNVEVKTSSDTYTRIGDVVPPSSQVTAAPFVSSGLFNLQMAGSKLSGAIMTQFDVYVVVDSNAAVLVGTASAVATSTAGQFTGSLTYQGLADGISHTYRFYSRGKDGSGNVEAAPVTGDVSVTVSFSAPAILTATGIDVQNSANQRSYVRYLDLLFSGDPSALLSGNIAVEKFGLNATDVTAGTGTAVTGFGMTQSSNKLKLDFGATGIGGLRDAGNGFYRVRLDMNQDGDFTDAVDQAFEFYRLFGDANGDKVVDVLDTNLVTAQVGRSGTNLDGDLDGNGTVNATDRLYTTQQRGKNLLLALRSLLDD
ncbi:MAG: cadherin domain-containing protein [Planctomycetales bacterium]|nr:cadherin domain-containing protein [Planctomycetales bacterium]